MSKAKFEVGDWANYAGSKLDGQSEPTTKLHILEVITQLCEAGIEQRSYICRLYVKDLRHGWAFSQEPVKFREMELEKRDH